MKTLMMFLAWVVAFLNLYLLLTVDWFKCIFEKEKE